MKKIIALIVMVAALCVVAEQIAIDMADTGTTANVTNNYSLGTVTYDAVFVTYDSSGITNDIVFYATVDSVDYYLGTSSVTNGQYDYVDLSDLALPEGGVFKAVTTETNVTIRAITK